MANLEDKILNGPAVGYCSSSDEEDDEDAPVIVPEEEIQEDSYGPVPRGIRNTGPKGVIEDWKAFTEEQEKVKIEKEKQIIAAAKFGMLTGKKEMEEEDEELEALRQLRLQQLKDCVSAKAKVVELTSKEQFLTAIEKCRNMLLLIHIYENGVVGCETMNEVMCSIAAQFPRVRLARVKSSVLETSARFTTFGLPTLQVYYSDTLVGNFVRICDQLGEDFKPFDLVQFLYSHDIDLALGRKEEKSAEDSDKELQ